MKAFVTSKIIGLLIRHFLAVAGGFMVANGYTDENTWETVAGGVSALGGIAMSAAEKYGRILPG